MNMKRKIKGFSIIELMVVVVIVAILVALAIPGYSRYIRKANRAEAQQLMLAYANLQETWRANDTDYATAAELAVPTHDRYVFYVDDTTAACSAGAPSATEYLIVACPQNDQANDEERGTSCSPLTLNQANIRGPADCW